MGSQLSPTKIKRTRDKHLVITISLITVFILVAVFGLAKPGFLNTVSFCLRNNCIQLKNNPEMLIKFCKSKEPGLCELSSLCSITEDNRIFRAPKCTQGSACLIGTGTRVSQCLPKARDYPR